MRFASIVGKFCYRKIWVEFHRQAILLNPNYALGMHSLPSGLMIRLRRMSRLNLVTLSVRVRHLSSDLTMKITNLVFLLGAKSLIFIRQLCNADSTVSIA
jgi:hypothetical protein